jgi:hypothetical protein
MSLEVDGREAEVPDNLSWNVINLVWEGVGPRFELLSCTTAPACKPELAMAAIGVVSARRDFKSRKVVMI